MDPTTLASGVVSLLVPYLAKAGKTIAEKVGEDAWNTVNSKIERLYDAIENKFRGNDYANQTLKRLEEKPEDKGRQSAIESVLKEVLAEDQQFQKMLSQFLAEAKQAGGDTIIQVYGSGAAATHRGVAAGEGGIAVGGNIIFQQTKNSLKPKGSAEIAKERSLHLYEIVDEVQQKAVDCVSAFDSFLESIEMEASEEIEAKKIGTSMILGH